MTAPAARKIPTRHFLHGDERHDEYHWLRDKTNPDVIALLEAENRYTDAFMQPTGELREQLYREILGRVKETDFTPPERRGEWFYYTRTEQGKQYAIYCRRHGSEQAAEEVLLDANALAEGQEYFRLGAFEPSLDHRLLAYSTDVEGDEVYTVRVKDLATGELLRDAVSGTSAPLEWANDNRTFFYTKVDAAKRPYRLYRHALGASADALVYQEADERFNLQIAKSKDAAFLFAISGSHTTTEYRCLPAGQPTGTFQVLLERRQDVEYEAAHHGAHFYLRINDTGKNFRLARMADTGGSLEELKPHRAEVTIERVDALRRHLVLLEREQGLRHISVEDFETGDRHRVAFDEPVYTVALADNPEFDTSLVRFTYASLTTPPAVFDYHMAARTRELKKQTEVPGGYDPSQYLSERVQATAPDGVQVPVSLVYRKGLARDGRAPLLLYGYGAYGLNSEPGFASDRVSLLDRGWVYAIAHVRGGADLGRNWYEDGKLMRKRNTFTDFIACAQSLIEQRYTSPERLAILGGSAGGLLIGAVLNLRPDLFHAAIAKVPFVDVLNTMLDATLPLTVIEYEEWGNPHDAAAYQYIRGYSPYDNVQPQRYPRLLITAGLNDPRVAYWEPAKWAARLRAAKVGDEILLLKTNMGAGHFGASGRYEKFRETAFEYAFLLTSFRLCEPGAPPERSSS